MPSRPTYLDRQSPLELYTLGHEFYGNLNTEGGTPAGIARLAQHIKDFGVVAGECAPALTAELVRLLDALQPEFGQPASLALAEFLGALEDVADSCITGDEEVVEEAVMRLQARVHRPPDLVGLADDPARRFRTTIHAFLNSVYRDGLSRERGDQLVLDVHAFGHTRAVWASELAQMFLDGVEEAMDDWVDNPSNAMRVTLLKLITLDAICANPLSESAQNLVAQEAFQHLKRTQQEPDA